MECSRAGAQRLARAAAHRARGSGRVRRRRFRSSVASALVVALAAVAWTACEVPTAPPKWDTTWEVPVQSTTISVADLVPADVTLNADSTAFLFSTDPVSVSQTLGDVCTTCNALDGTTAPKPAFTGSFSESVGLPAEIVSLTIAGGDVVFDATNGFGFDPIQPPGGSPGMITIAVESGANPLGADTIDGADTAFPPGTSQTATIALSRTTASSFGVDVFLDSPAGDPVFIDASSTFSIGIEVRALAASAIELAFTDQTLSTAPVQIELEDVDGPIIDRVQSGAVELEIYNPFDLQGTFDLIIEAPAGTIQKTVQFAAADTTGMRIDLSAAELQAVLGQSPVQYRLSGSLTSPGGTITISPSQAITIKSRIELVLGPAEE